MDRQSRFLIASKLFFVKPHMALKGETPASKVGIEVNARFVKSRYEKR